MSDKLTMTGCDTGPTIPKTRKVAIFSEPSPLGRDGLSRGQYLCQECGKRFGLLCQLNKHTKAHSRPHKCPQHDCKYFSEGWPTVKELERHVNDKHSDAPETYPCLYDGCPYKSKRDSNRKQHMEKVHDWVYDRTKSNKKRIMRPSDAPSSSAGPPSDPTTDAPATHSASARKGPPQVDWVLYDDKPEDLSRSCLDNRDGHMERPGLKEPNGQDCNVVVPWTSPETRLERRKTDLRNFNVRFHHNSAAAGSVPVDPQLLSSSLDTVEIVRHSPSPSGPKVPVAVRSSAGAARFAAAHQRPSSLGAPEQPGTWPHNISFSTGDSRLASRQPEPQRRPLPRRGVDSDQDTDDGHQKKRLKTTPLPNFEENRMPDIFHARYPDTYNRNKKAVYSSCLTFHQNISTLARHLSRPPHRLTAVERYISSFDVPAQDGVPYAHTRAGVCRKCWQTFDSRAEFSGHIATDCEKVSKGKREKWNILFHAFTPRVTDAMSSSLTIGTNPTNTAVPPPPRQGASQPGARSILGLSCAADNDAPHDPPSPTASTVEPGLAERREPVSPGLLTALGSLLLPHLDDEHDVPDAEKLRRFQALKERARTVFQEGMLSRARQRDRQQVLRGLKLQHNELPRGLMDEINSQQPLSRTSSGPSSDRITHVPTSPLHRPEDFMGIGHGHPALGHSAGRYHLLAPSITDSGYDSANQISLTQSEAARLKTINPGPRHPLGDQPAVAITDGQYEQQEQQETGHPLGEGSPDPQSPSTAFAGLEGFELGYDEGLEIIDRTPFP